VRLRMRRNPESRTDYGDTQLSIYTRLFPNVWRNVGAISKACCALRGDEKP